jgi:hypothetical protein
LTSRSLRPWQMLQVNCTSSERRGSCRSIFTPLPSPSSESLLLLPLLLLLLLAASEDSDGTASSSPADK